MGYKEKDGMLEVCFELCLNYINSEGHLNIYLLLLCAR